MATRIVLGINAAHDAAACLLKNGEIVVAIPEERLSRIKRHEGYPYRAVEYCLQHAGLHNLNQVDAMVINEYVTNDFGLELRQTGFRGELVVNPSHHLLHAYYAWIASNYSHPAVLILDGDGYSYGEYDRRKSPLLGPPPKYSDMEEAESMYVVGGHDDLMVIQKRWALWEAAVPFSRFPSLGHMFSAASEYIFGHMEHAGKTMGLAPYGDASYFPDPIVDYTSDGLVIDTIWVTKLPTRSRLPAHLDPICRNVAAKVQKELERALIYLCNVLHQATGADELCYSGGVGLNTVANGLILRQTPFSRLFVTPASGDSGIAIGAALYGDRLLSGERPQWRSYNNYHGHDYSSEEVKTVVRQRERLLLTDPILDVAGAAAHDLADGKFIGWFEGPSEFGPRALGHRSILCDPRPIDMKERLNATVKFREPFRPYAASVLAESVKDFFDVVEDDPFMLTVASVLEPKRTLIPSVCHVDGTCRIQTVGDDYPGSFRSVIERFYEISGIPLVLNTSFNVRGEPIVETPDDALRCFLSCNLDVLYLNGYRITKVLIESAADPTALVPALNDSILAGSTVESRDGGVMEPRYYCQTRTGYRATISAHEYELLLHMDARRTIRELARVMDASRIDNVLATVASLQRRGFVALMLVEGKGELNL